MTSSMRGLETSERQTSAIVFSSLKAAMTAVVRMRLSRCNRHTIAQGRRQKAEGRKQKSQHFCFLLSAFGVVDRSRFRSWSGQSEFGGAAARSDRFRSARE